MKDITEAVLDFWLGDRTRPAPQPFWFKSTPELDADIRARFLGAHERARAGDLDRRVADADDHLAIIVMLDQFPRNMFRGTPRAFATDALARRWAERALDAGHDARYPSPHARMFFYLPFEHSEAQADQDRSVALFRALGDAEYLRHAEEHRNVIARFGRFPHRNAILGRQSTAAEADYLNQPGAGF